MTNPDLCDACNRALEDKLNPEIFVALRSMMRVVRDAELDATRADGAGQSQPEDGHPQPTPRRWPPVPPAELEADFTGVMGAKVFWLALLTLLPLLIGLKVTALSLTVSPATLVYAIYHALGIYIWLVVKQLTSPLGRGLPPAVQEPRWRLCGRLQRVVSKLVVVVAVLLLLTFLAKVQIVFFEPHRIPLPRVVYAFVGVPLPPSGRILSPTRAQALVPSFEASGTVSGIAKGQHVWLAVKRGRALWPKVEVETGEEQWHAQIGESSTNDAPPFSLILLLIDERQQGTIETWLQQEASTGQYAGLPENKLDFKILDSVHGLALR